MTQTILSTYLDHGGPSPTSRENFSTLDVSGTSSRSYFGIDDRVVRAGRAGVLIIAEEPSLSQFCCGALVTSVVVRIERLHNGTRDVEILSS